LLEGEIKTIRTIIHNYCIIERRQPTLKGKAKNKIKILFNLIMFASIYNKIIDSGINFQGGLTTLSKIISKMGFK
jgi:hypothetical protein